MGIKPNEAVRGDSLYAEVLPLDSHCGEAHTAVIQKTVSDSRWDAAEAPAAHTCTSSAGFVYEVSIQRLEHRDEQETPG